MGIKIHIGRLKISGGSLSQYWTQRWITASNFYELWKVTGAGTMTGLKRGDPMTITGSGLNAIYAVPDTAPYKTRDTDYVFHKSNGDVSTLCDGNRLVGYDFAKIIVKYLDVSPYTIEYIGILDTGQSVTNQMRDDFHLSRWWDNTLSLYGYAKGNRAAEQSVWTAESVVITYLSDTFTDANGTLLSAHTMDVGAGWTADSHLTIITGGLLHWTSAGGTSSYYTVAESGHADVDISIDFSQLAIGDYIQGLVFRYINDSSRWRLMMERDGGGTPYIVLLENGINRGVANITQETGVMNKLKVVCSGNNISCYWKDMVTPLLTYSSATNNAATKHGVANYGPYVGADADNFLCKSL